MRCIKRSIFFIFIPFILLLATNCTSPTEPGKEIPDIAAGEFIATVDNDYTFSGEASFDTVITNYPYVSDAHQDTIAFLVLKAGEIEVPEREPIPTGIFLNSLWNENNPKFEIGSYLYFISYYHSPRITNASFVHSISSGKVILEEYSEFLLSGSFDLTAKDAIGDSVSITGLFRAVIAED